MAGTRIPIYGPALFAARVHSPVCRQLGKWHEYRDENRLLKTVAAKHEITSVMLNELYPELSVTVGAYEELVDVVGVDSTLAIFNRQVKIARRR